MKKRFMAGLIFLMLAVCFPVMAKSGTDSGVKNIAQAYRNAAGKSARKAADEKAWRKIDGVCYNGSGEVIPGAITRGIDVSSWQEKIDWKKVKKSDVDFAFIRLIHGLDLVDKYYDYNIRNAVANGIPVGIYVYSKALTIPEAIEEAQYAIRRVRGYKISYPIVYDMEDGVHGALTNRQRTDLTIAFCNEIKKAGYYPMVYTNISWYEGKLDMSRLASYDVWLARFSDTIVGPDRDTYRYTIWQATGGDTSPGMRPTKGLIDGIPTWNNADINFGFVDYTKKITPRYEALSSYTPTSTGKTGWVSENEQTYYYLNGSRVKGIRKIGGDTFWFSSKDGHLFKNTMIYTAASGFKKMAYAGNSGALAKNAWVSWKGKKYYMGDDCYAVKRSQKIGDYFYYFHPLNGYMLTNYLLRLSGGRIYYYGGGGIRAANKFFTITHQNGRKYTYGFSKSGLAYTGWRTIGGKLYYFYEGDDWKTGVRAQNTTITIDGQLCTFDKDGVCTSKKAKK